MRRILFTVFSESVIPTWVVFNEFELLSILESVWGLRINRIYRFFYLEGAIVGADLFCDRMDFIHLNYTKACDSSHLLMIIFQCPFS